MRLFPGGGGCDKSSASWIRTVRSGLEQVVSGPGVFEKRG